MIRRAVTTASVLALGAAGGALLGGCGGGTKTVTVPAAPAPAANTGTVGAKGASAARRGTAGSPTTGAGGSTSTAGAGAGEAGQSAGTTRTAPAPAFTRTAGRAGEGAPGAQAAAAEAVVRARGYVPADVTAYHADQTLRVLLGTREGSAGAHEQHAFFFLGGRYLGTDTGAPSASIRVAGQSDTEVALAYALYRPHDALCCPSGGAATVRFQLNNGELVPLGTIPPAASANGPARR
jgi:hypothetical protein